MRVSEFGTNSEQKMDIIGKNDEKPVKKSYKTRLLIMRTFIDLMRYTDYPKIKVTEICETAGITRGTFYKYFSDIDDLIIYIEDAILSDFPCVSCDGRAKPAHFPTLEECRDYALWQRLFEFYKSYSIPLNTLLGPNGDRSFRYKITSRIQTELERSMTADGLPKDTFRKYFHTIIPDIYLTLAREWVSGDDDPDFNMSSLSAVLNCLRIGAMYTNALDTENSKRGGEGED